ncbi:MAG: hypothetical protein QXF26_01045 [Candidatus Bathyarchaeia archaeon]
MSVEGVSYFVAVAIVIMVIGSILFRVMRREREVTGDVLRRMKEEYFPKLEANLKEIQTKLERLEPGDYSKRVTEGLSATLNLEFRLRMHDKARKLDQLVEDLSMLEKELSALASSPRDETLASKVRIHSSKCRDEVSRLINDVRELQKIEKLPSKSPVVGH